MKNIVVFCGANGGSMPVYQAEAQKLGEFLAQNAFRLVYGGGFEGMMGTLARAVLAHQGEAIGVIPHFLIKQEQKVENFLPLTQQIVVKTMHERKQTMADLAHAFVILAGGIGTLDEFFEILTWQQLQIHQKPIFLLNTAGFYDKLIEFMQQVEQAGFLRIAFAKQVQVCNSVTELGSALQKCFI